MKIQNMFGVRMLAAKGVRSGFAASLTVALLGVGTEAAAQLKLLGSGRLGVEAGVSTLGAFIAPELHIIRRLRVRVPVYTHKFYPVPTTLNIGPGYGGYDRKEGKENDFEVDFASVHMTSTAAIADFYPRRKGLRVSGGFMLGGYHMEGKTTNPVLDGVPYDGDFELTLKTRNFATPLFAVGLQKTIFGIGVFGELGGLMSTTELTVTGQENLPTDQRAEFNAVVTDINDELSDFGITPFVSIGAVIWLN